MRLQIFTIFDAKAEAFLRPFVLPTVAHARRELAEVMQQPTGPFVDYPEDFTSFTSANSTTKLERFNLLSNMNPMEIFYS